MRGDPVELPHRYANAQDIEVAALLPAPWGYGRADPFKPRLTALLEALGPSPAAVARNSTPVELLERTRGFSYRMTGARDVACVLSGAGGVLREHGSLGAAFAKQYGQHGSVRAALGGFVDALGAPDFTPLTGKRARTRRLKHLLPHPGRGSACKRLNLFLRW